MEHPEKDESQPQFSAVGMICIVMPIQDLSMMNKIDTRRSIIINKNNKKKTMKKMDL